MKILLFGATGMIGQGVLRECLLAPDVDGVLAVGRAATGVTHAKLKELVHADMTDVSAIADQLAGFDACFFCLGVSAAGMSEEAYTRITYDVTLGVARAIVARTPSTVFIYVSGGGTDASEKGGTMWARVKGKTENALLALPFSSSYMFRPAYIQPLHGIRSKTPMYRAVYAVMGPLYPVWRALAPKYVTTTEHLGRAMLEVARHGAPKRVLENDELHRIAEGANAAR